MRFLRFVTLFAAGDVRRRLDRDALCAQLIGRIRKCVNVYEVRYGAGAALPPSTTKRHSPLACRFHTVRYFEYEV